MDRKGGHTERDNPKSLLVPGTLPLPVHTLMEMDDDSTSDDNLPSTIDLDALKGSGPTDTPFLNMNMGWRSPPRVKARQFNHEILKKDQGACNGLETESQSDESNKNSDGSSSESEDSDSGSESSSESDSSEDSTGSSDSSESSDSNKSSSESALPHNKSSSPSMKKGTVESPTHRLQVPKPKPQDTRSIGNSSTSSRSRKIGSKSFSIKSSYEPGSLKLKIAAFDPSRSAQLQSQEIKIPCSSTICLSSPKPTLQSQPIKLQPSNGGDASLALRIPAPATMVNGDYVDLATNHFPKKINVPLPKDGRRITRQSFTHKGIEDSLTIIQTDGVSSMQKNGLVSRIPESVSPSLAVPTSLAKKSIKEPYCQTATQFCFSNSKNNLVPVGVTSQLTDSVTMTRLIAAPVSRESSVPPTLQPPTSIPAALPLVTSRSRSEHLSDPVLYLATKNNDLSIFPINPEHNKILPWNSNVNATNPKVLITPNTSINSASTTPGLSPVRVSRRLSTHRVSLDKSDVESWDSADLGISEAIKTMDSVVDSEKLKHPLTKKMVIPSRVNEPVSNKACHSSSSSSSGYISPLTENYTKSNSSHHSSKPTTVTFNSPIKKRHQTQQDATKSSEGKANHSPKKRGSSHSNLTGLEIECQSEVETTKGNVQRKEKKTEAAAVAKKAIAVKTPSKSVWKSSSSTSSNSSTQEPEATKKSSKSKLSIFVALSGGKGPSRAGNGRHAVVGAYSNNTKMPPSLTSSVATNLPEPRTKKSERRSARKAVDSQNPQTGIETTHKLSLLPPQESSPAKVAAVPKSTCTTTSTPPTPIRTKAAKKYIPEPVLPVPEADEELVSRKCKKQSDRKRGGSKRSAEHKRSNITRKGKKGLLSDEEVDLLCRRLSLQCSVVITPGRKSTGRTSPRKGRAKRPKSTSPSAELLQVKKERFTFEKMIFSNYATPFKLPPPSFANSKSNLNTVGTTTTPGTESSHQSFQTSGHGVVTLASVNPSRTSSQMQRPTGSGPGAAPSRRKRNVILAKTSSTSKTVENVQENAAELQRLPLKKRHGHTSNTNKGSEEALERDIVIGEHKFGATTMNAGKLVLIDTRSSFFGKKAIPSFPGFSDLSRNRVAELNGKLEDTQKTKLLQGRRSKRVRNHSEKELSASSDSAANKPLPSTQQTVKVKSEKEVNGDKISPSRKRFLNTQDVTTRPKRLRLSAKDTVPVVTQNGTAPTRSSEKIATTPMSSPKSGSSSQLSPTSAKKRRKVNRTGFPSVKKKKKSANSPLSNEVAPLTPPDSIEVQAPAENLVATSPYKIKSEKINKTDAESESIVKSATKVSKKGTQAAVAESLATESKSTPAPAIPSSSQGKKAGEGFTATLTERVKIRKRNSVDGITPQDYANVISGEIVIDGVIPSLLSIPDPPIIIPEKTNFLPAGFLSNYFKHMVPPPLPTPEEFAASVTQLKGPMLPLPADLGLQTVPIHEVLSDFQLPYDIWCLGVIRTREKYDEWVLEEEERRARERVQKKVELRRKAGASKPKKIQMPDITPDSWNFKRLRSNAYFGYTKPPVSTESEVDQLCECKGTEYKCGGEDCLNRVVFTECPAACGEKCMNRRIQKHEWAPHIKRFLTETKGYGVKTLKAIKQGDFILEYVGEVVLDAIFKDRMNTVYANDQHHYCLQLDSGRVIDGHRSGGEGRFVNHSCEPNCEMQKWSVNGLSRMALFALRDIEDNEELSYDYNFSLYNPSEGQVCHCQSQNCRGVIGGKSKNNSLNIKSKRKSGNSKGLPGIAAASSEPVVLDRMKLLTRKERNVIIRGHCFLVRNYEKMRRTRGEFEDILGDKLEKLMSGWISRFRVGSTKNKPLQVGDEDPELARVARIAQILYELYSTLVNSKDPTGKLLCEPFMEPPPKRKYPNFWATLVQQKLLGFKSIEKNILRGKYKVIQAFEADVRIVLTSFSQAFETERPEVKDLVVQISKKYKNAKQIATQALDPFIVPRGSGQNSVGQRRSSSANNNLPAFIKYTISPGEDVVRCICGTYSEEGEMVQCETCLVWQHSDCMRWVDPNNASSKHRRGINSIGKKSNRAWSPKKAIQKLSQKKALDLPKMTPPKRTISTDSDEKEKVEFGEGELISVKEVLPLLEAKDEEMMADFSEILETQVLELVDAQEPTTSEATKNIPYYCELCQPREVDPEVPMGAGNDTPEKTHYLTLKREDGLMLRRNDTVYVLREWPEDQRTRPDGTPLPRKTYLTAGTLVASECDIFRIDSLWKDAKGNQMVMGYNYLRPHETHHEPSRKFYPNEILRAPIHEMIGIDLINGRCWVVDATTYCKGRPKGCIEEHLYICDMRVDKTARSFDKVGKRSQMVCTKPFAFDHFETKLKIQRNVHPHGPPSPDFKSKPSGAQSGGIEKVKGRKTEDKGKKSASNSSGFVQTDKQKALKRKRINMVLDTLHSRVEDFLINKVDSPQLLVKDERRGEKFRKSSSKI